MKYWSLQENLSVDKTINTKGNATLNCTVFRGREFPLTLMRYVKIGGNKLNFMKIHN